MSIRLRQITIALVLLLSLLAACQPKGPKIEISPAERDLGQVQQKPLETTYTVRNGGVQPLEIARVYTNCDCTTASVDSKALAPGEETTLRVAMDPALLDLYGNIRREIILETNDPRTPVARAVLKVTIQKP
jgi:predicted small lipoprotein YifL